MEIYGSLSLGKVRLVLDSVFKLGEILLFNDYEKVKVVEVERLSPFPTYIVEEYDPNYFQNSINHFKFLVKYNLVV